MPFSCHSSVGLTAKKASLRVAVFPSAPAEVMSESVFVHLTSLAGQVHAPHGSLQTQPFLDVCAQVIPVVGGPAVYQFPSIISPPILKLIFSV